MIYGKLLKNPVIICLFYRQMADFIYCGSYIDEEPDIYNIYEARKAYDGKQLHE